MKRLCLCCRVHMIVQRHLWVKQTAISLIVTNTPVSIWLVFLRIVPPGGFCYESSSCPSTLMYSAQAQLQQMNFRMLKKWQDFSFMQICKNILISLTNFILLCLKLFKFHFIVPTFDQVTNAMITFLKVKSLVLTSLTSCFYSRILQHFTDDMINWFCYGHLWALSC